MLLVHVCCFLNLSCALTGAFSPNPQPSTRRVRTPPKVSGETSLRVRTSCGNLILTSNKRVRNSPLELLERVASTKHVSAAASRVSQKFVSDGQALRVLFLPLLIRYAVRAFGALRRTTFSNQLEKAFIMPALPRGKNSRAHIEKALPCREGFNADILLSIIGRV